MWAEIWDAMAGTNIVSLAEHRHDIPTPATAEAPTRGSWADPHGPGRCARCAIWLKHDDTYKWSVQARGLAKVHAALDLCGPCTSAVLSVWRPPK